MGVWGGGVGGRVEAGRLEAATDWTTSWFTDNLVTEQQGGEGSASLLGHSTTAV